jgi:CBS domain containing-hemolysin-like protein
MTESTISRSPRADGAEPQQSLSGLFRSWLRASLRGKSEASWRDTIEELIEEQGEPETAVASHERILLANILRLKGLTAYDVMVPRADIVAVEVDQPIDDVLRLLTRQAHSRVPVYRETLDEVVGMVHIKDVLASLSEERQGVRLRDLVRDVLIVAPSMPVLDLLLEMRESRQHMALVVDEFGGIDGLITIEDLVEEIVGEIEDEHDNGHAPEIEAEPEGTWLADARLPLDEFERAVGPVAPEEDEDIDTLGGLVFAIAGRIPARGEVLRHPAGLEFEVVDADPRRIKRLRVRRVQGDGRPEDG